MKAVGKTKQKTASKAVKETPWVPLTSADLVRCEQGFTHFTGKTVHSSVGDVSLRLAAHKPRPDLPYLGLTTLGVGLSDLDYTEGGARFVRLPRQIKDIATGTSSGAHRNLSQVPPAELAQLDPNGAFVQSLLTERADLPDTVPALLKQLIVPVAGADTSLTPIGAIGLSVKIMDRLEKERQRREAVDPENKRRFWKAGTNILGGKKPQNIGLICTVEGGKAAAGFAWYFSAPGFQRHSRQRQWASLFRPFSFPLKKSFLADLDASLTALKTKGDQRSKRWARSCIAEIGNEIRSAAVQWRQGFMDKLRADYGATEVTSDEALWKRLVGQAVCPSENEGLWMRVQESVQQSLYAGWLQKSNARTHAWRKEAAAELVGQWLHQMDSLMSSVDRRVLESWVAEEIV